MKVSKVSITYGRKVSKNDSTTDYALGVEVELEGDEKAGSVIETFTARLKKQVDQEIDEAE
jgi:hypothetical protein